MVISTAAIATNAEDPLGQRQEEPSIQLTGDAPDVPGDATDERAGQRQRGKAVGREPGHRVRSCHIRIGADTTHRQTGRRHGPASRPLGSLRGERDPA